MTVYALTCARCGHEWHEPAPRRVALCRWCRTDDDGQRDRQRTTGNVVDRSRRYVERTNPGVNVTSLPHAAARNDWIEGSERVISSRRDLPAPDPSGPRRPDPIRGPDGTTPTQRRRERHDRKA